MLGEKEKLIKKNGFLAVLSGFGVMFNNIIS